MVSSNIKSGIELFDHLRIVTTVERKHSVCVEFINCLGHILKAGSGIHRWHIHVLMMEELILVQQGSSIIYGLRLSPRAKRVRITSLQVWICTDFFGLCSWCLKM